MQILHTIHDLEAKRSELRGKMNGVNRTDCKGLQTTYQFAHERLTLKLRELYRSADYQKALDARLEAYSRTPVAKFLKSTNGLNGMQILTKAHLFELTNPKV